MIRTISRNGLSALLALALSAPLAGCGGGESSADAPRRAGSEPIPSSQPRVAVPASSSSAPMFAGAAAGPPRLRPGQRPGGIFGQALAEEERARAAERGGPERLEDPDAEGRRIALETMEELREAQAAARAAGGDDEDGDDGPCDEAWDARVAQRRHLDRNATPAEQRRSFMARCRALPEDQRQCMSPSYQAAHPQECAEIQDRAARRIAREAGATIPR